MGSRTEFETRPALLETALETQPSGSSLAPSLLLLHDLGGDAASLAPLLSGCAAPKALALQAARPLNPLASNSALAPRHQGYRWWIEDPDGQPDASSYGDSLVQIVNRLEQLRESSPWAVFGLGQGASMALALAAVASDLLEGAWIAGSGWQVPLGWQPALRGTCPVFVLESESSQPKLGPLEGSDRTVQRETCEELNTQSLATWLARTLRQD